MSDPESTPEQGGADQDGNRVGSSKPKLRNWKVLLGLGGAIVLVGAVTGIAASVTQPTPIERAGEACSGTKPLDSFLAGLDDSESPAPTPSETRDADAQQEFDEMFDGVLAVEDDGRTLIISTKPADDDALGLTSLVLDCVYEELDTPRHVSELISATRALDGRQTGDWGDFSASWGYHPDSGLNLIIAAK